MSLFLVLSCHWIARLQSWALLRSSWCNIKMTATLAAEPVRPLRFHRSLWAANWYFYSNTGQEEEEETCCSSPWGQHFGYLKIALGVWKKNNPGRVERFEYDSNLLQISLFLCWYLDCQYLGWTQFPDIAYNSRNWIILSFKNEKLNFQSA